MILIPLGVIWLGYSLLWNGYAMTKGPGIGLGDLIFPSRIAKVDAWREQQPGSKPDNSTAAQLGAASTDAMVGLVGSLGSAAASGQLEPAPISRPGIQ